MHERNYILCQENLEPHQRSGRNAKINPSWHTTPSWPLVTFWFISANYLKNNQSLQSECFGRALVCRGSLTYKLITKIVEEHDSRVFRGKCKHREKGPFHLGGKMAGEGSTDQVTLDKQKQ